MATSFVVDDVDDWAFVYCERYSVVSYFFFWCEVLIDEHLCISIEIILVDVRSLLSEVCEDGFDSIEACCGQEDGLSFVLSESDLFVFFAEKPLESSESARISKYTSELLMMREAFRCCIEDIVE